MITSSRHLLTLGAVDFTDPDGGIMFMAGDANSWGSPQSVVAIVESLIADGSLVKWQRDDNRTVAFNVDITGSDSGELAWREAALVAELYRPNQLTWVPPDAVAPPSVFTVLTSSMELKPLADGFDELLLRRTYTVTLTCAPYVSSSQPTTIQAVQTAGPGSVTISSGSATTGWTGGRGASVTSVSGALVLSPIADPAPTLSYWFATAVYTFASAQSMTTTPYLSIDVQINGTDVASGATVHIPQPTITVNGTTTAASFIAGYASPANAGYYRYIYSVPVSSLTSLQFDWAANGVWTPSGFVGPDSVTFLALARTTTPTAGNGHELIYLSSIGGSRRAPASLRLYRNTTGFGGSIGDALIYTGPDLQNGFIPSLRWYAVGGTTDSAAWTGKYGWTTAPQVPASSLRPAAYVVVARIKGPSALTSAALTWSATLSGRTTSVTTHADVSTTYQLITLGGLVLPPSAVPDGSSLSVSIDITVGSGTIQVDDAWLLPLDEGSAITVVKGAGSNVWSNAPTFDHPSPSLFTGSDQASAVSAQNVAGGWDIHLVEPGMLQVYVACNATDAQLTITYTKQWHTHAAE